MTPEPHPIPANPGSTAASPNPSRADRYHGAILGLATGDALGVTVEFKPPGTFEPIHDMQGGGPYHIKMKPGEWTDDTSMALCLAESLIETGRFDPTDQLERYVRWWRDGHLSSVGTCFDIGTTTSRALRTFETTHDPNSGSTDTHTAGNGSIMRLAPVPLAYANHPRRAIELAAASSRTTHGATTAVDACRLLAALTVGALHDTDKRTLLSEHYTPVPNLWNDEPLHPDIDAIARGSYKTKNPPEIKGTGHVVPSLEAALWAFHTTSTYEEGLINAVNLGNDADTTGAIYGQLAGAHYGIHAIPQRWLEPLAKRDLLERYANGLLEYANAQLTNPT